MQRVTAFTVTNGLMFLAFAYSVAVQFNDPDPVRWVIMYGAAAAACLVPARQVAAPYAAGVVGLAAVVWSATIAPHVIGKTDLGDLFRTMDRKTPEVEYGREMLGLAIIAAWMAVLAVRGWRSRAD
jgi:hypothetical protein